MLIPGKLSIGFIYLLIIALATFGTTVTIGYWWKRNELPRRVIGIAMVMLLGLPTIAAANYTGPESWLLLTLGFVTAGAIRGIREVIDNNRKHEAEKRRAMAEVERVRNE